MSQLQDYLIAVRWADEQRGKLLPGNKYPSKELEDERTKRFYAMEKVYNEKVLEFIQTVTGETVPVANQK